MSPARAPALGLLALLLALGCHGEPASGLRLWPRPDAAAGPGVTRWVSERPFLLSQSSYLDVHRPAGRHEPGTQGDFAVGNGSVFSLLGYGRPAHALHGMIGPTYQKDAAFFPDTWIELLGGPAGQALPLTEERTARVRGTAIVLSQALAPPLSLHVVTFSPLLAEPPGAPLPAEARAILRVLIVRNDGDRALPVRLRVRFAGAVVPLGERAVERLGERRRESQLLTGGVAAAEGLLAPLEELAPGEERVLTLAHVLSTSAADTEATLAALGRQGVDALLASTHDEWLRFTARGVVLESPDPRVDDLVDGMKVTIRLQQARSGGVSEMSQYSKAWLRDVIGPVRFFLRAGYFAEARAMLDYLYRAALVTGDLRNSYRLDLPVDAPPPPPDWARLPPLAGTVAAESPSVLVLAFLAYHQYTGDGEFLADRLPFLTSCLLRQAAAGGLLPFSGDETFRAAMSIALGLPAAYAYEEKALSASSSFLFAAAADGLAALARGLGREAEARALSARGGEVRDAAEARYFLPDLGWYAPFIDRSTGQPERRPFEDVSLLPLWAGYAGPQEERAARNLTEVIARLGGRPGTLQSLPEENLLGPRGADGVHTGMVPGYYLYDLALLRHPLAEAAFNALGAAASASGNYGEYQFAGDHTTLQIFYDPAGERGDYTARLRSWEGGVNLDALLFYLTGLLPEEPGASFRLSPQLPNGWPGYRLRHLRFGKETYTLDVRDDGAGPAARLLPESQGRPPP